VAITEQTDQGDILRILGNWQTAIVDRISNIGALSIAVACVVVVGITALVTRRRSAATPP
jgi:hypothetical protein